MFANHRRTDHRRPARRPHTPRAVSVPVVTAGMLAFLSPFAAPDASAQDVRWDHYVLIRVAHVPPEWQRFHEDRGGGFSSAATIKETSRAKYYEIAIWEDIKAVHLYAFDNTFNPHGGPGWAQHRESYAIRRETGMPDDRRQRSEYLRNVLGAMFAMIAQRHPSSGYGLVYSGHGSPGGALFDYQVLPHDANEMLRQWTRILGRKLDFIDMGGPCNKGSFSDLANFCQYSRYYIASDLPNGGYSMDDWTIEKANQVNPDLQYHSLLNAPSLRSALVERVNLMRAGYLYSRNNMIANRTEQAGYLYDCNGFLGFAGPFNEFFNRYSGGTGRWIDAVTFLQRNNGGAHVQRFLYDVIIHRADNRDFFPWDSTAHGMLKLDHREAWGQRPEPAAARGTSDVTRRTPHVIRRTSNVKRLRYPDRP